ncbi:MAG: protein phosphatase 2C domain-containing protein, partial [Christensenellaceae bacterium]|nr:protein phosphatase 2C domain-containing protein [Christensenellaceae bacterium]
MERYALTHKGRVRKKNEDTVYTFVKGQTLVAMVADGMGGHEGGQLASKTAVRLLSAKLREEDCDRLTPRALQYLLEQTSHELWKLAQREESHKDMGT